jgi:1-hydroxycarotenoid 3,4-desaturase
MAGAIRRRVRSPHIRDVLLRFATYAGSDPRRAPATLGCITHVEMALGGYGVAGGIGALVRAMVRVAERQGVELRLGEPVEQVLVSAGRATGVRTPRGELPAEVVVSNAEVAHLHADLLGRKAPAAPTSTSGWNAIVRAAVADRAAHTVLFPATYGDEFVDLFDRRRVPRDPALYVCAQRLAHAREGWPGEEPLFLMVNAPPVGAGEEPDAEALEATSMRRLREAGLVDAGARVLWRRTPRGLAERFPRSQGALYGAAHDGPTAALFRPSNRVSGVGGLFVASGTAHPGGGLPLVALSGRAAANEALRDLGLPGAA